MTVRPAVPGDAAAIATIQVDSWHATYRGLILDEAIDRMTVEAREPLWARTIESDGVVFVAIEEDTVVAFCAAARSRGQEGPVGEIVAMYASPAVLGRGHGRRLMEAVLAWFSEQGFDSAVLWVLGANRLGRTFYEKAGWRPDGVESDDEIHGAPVHHVRYGIDL
ncbi:MAG: GNAT family N-acetyltransferase [Acidimicrobiia bacterium]|nr:GNAT family N-acetyltransferase [Acidimicrobiia bacterium]